MPERTSNASLTRQELIALLVGVPAIVAVIIVTKPLVTKILNEILHLQPALVYTVVGLLVFAEAALFFGFVFPGETAVILGGVVASGGRVNVVALAAIVVVAAIVGDSVGYLIGHEYGEKIIRFKILQKRRHDIEKALELLGRRGGLAVFLGRFTAFLRAVMPALAGTSRMRYRTFFAANAAGAVLWGIGYTLLGYYLGNAYHRAEKYAGWVSSGLLIVVVLVAVGLLLRSRLRERADEEDLEDTRSPDEIDAELLGEIAALTDHARDEGDGPPA